MPQFNATLVPAPDQVVVRLTGDADLSTTPFVAEVLARAGSLRTRQVVVDVGSARFWDCSGLHALAGFTRELADEGRACRIAGAQPDTRRLIGMANLAGDLQLDGVVPARTQRGVPAISAPPRRVTRMTGRLAAAGHPR